MKVDPPFHQKAETELRKESPQDWQWSRTAGQTVTDWDAYFADTLGGIRRYMADNFRKKYAISSNQYNYLLTSRCPINGELTDVTYYKTETPLPGGLTFTTEIKLHSWFWGTDSDPFDDKLVKGSFGQCRQRHTWFVWAADEGTSKG